MTSPDIPPSAWCKRRWSPYRGGRTFDWLKVKVARYRERQRGWERKPSKRG